MSKRSPWPVLNRYEPPHLARVAMPLGGIGAGSISIGGRGDLRDWELFNRPSKGFTPCALDVWAGVMLHTRTAKGQTDLRMLEGPLSDNELEGSVGATTPNHGVPHFRNCRYEAAYPLAQVSLHDQCAPLEAKLQAFSPVIPGDADNSSLPVIQLRYLLRNRTEEAVDAAVVANLPNPVGLLPQTRQVLGNGRVQYEASGTRTNRFRSDPFLKGIFCEATGLDTQASNFGTLALTTPAEADVSYRTAWLGNRYHSALLDFRNDLDRDGRLSEREGSAAKPPAGSLAVHLHLGPGEEREVYFYLTWHFPNRWVTRPDEPDYNVGNWYTEQYSDAWDAARTIIPCLPELEDRTVLFTTALAECDLPKPIREAMLCNLSTLFTETCYRLPDGTLCSFEGCGDNTGCCEGSCTHVWNYESTLAYLYGDLARGMRRVEFTHALNAEGAMSFRILHPHKTHGNSFGKAAADGQAGCVLKAYREWRLSGDAEFLGSLWPMIRKSMEYCWIPGGWDADQDGVMEGCQHNTMDVEYFGPNPQMQCWYLGALKAAAVMARHCGESGFAQTCEALYQNGRRWTEENLFNGEYYEHRFEPPVDPSAIAPGQRLFEDKAIDDAHQLLDGCLVDQLVGQNLAYACGLGDVLSPDQQRRTLRSILKHNHRESLHGHFNPMRTFTQADEPCLLMASFPRNDPPEFPFPYFAEVMTGCEYTAAVGMIYSDLREEGLQCIQNIRRRYDGRRRNPFDEAECGHHYIRAMACWQSAIAWTGFDYSALDQRIIVDNRAGSWFWSNGRAWGRYHLSGDEVKLSVLSGNLTLSCFEVRNLGLIRWPSPQRIGDEMVFALKNSSEVS